MTCELSLFTNLGFAMYFSTLGIVGVIIGKKVVDKKIEKKATIQNFN